VSPEIFRIGFANKDSSIPADGIDILVGKPPHARKIHVSHAALKATPALRRRISEGSTITNTDPIIFEIALQYIEQDGFFENMRPVAVNPFRKLVGGSDMMLKLVKAWHLAHMLELPHVQNKLIDTSSTCYRHFLETHTRIPLSPEPFRYLRDHLGYYTNCEKFLIDFHAGIARNGADFNPAEIEQLLDDIARELRHRRADMLVRGILGDRIAQGDNSFKVSDSDNTLRVSLQILAPVASSSRSSPAARPTRPRLDRPVSSMSTVLSAANIQSIKYTRGHRPQLSLPVVPGVPQALEDAMERALHPKLRSAFQPASRPHARSTSML
jgi:hypothetical protein